MFGLSEHTQTVRYTILLVGSIILGNFFFYSLANIFGTFKPFLASSEFELQLGYFTASFIHSSNQHLLINLSMLAIGAAIFRKNVSSSSFVTILVLACGMGALIGYSYIGDMIGYSGFAAGSSGISFGLLANSSLVSLDRVTLKRVGLKSIVPVFFFLFEFIRMIGFKSELFVSNNPMSNVAHISAIIVGYVIVVSYMVVTNSKYTGVLNRKKQVG